MNQATHGVLEMIETFAAGNGGCRFRMGATTGYLIEALATRTTIARPICAYAAARCRAPIAE